MPAEFPARLCHGISASCGKAGAIVGAFGFLYAAQSEKDVEQDKGYPTGIGVKISISLVTVINAAGFFCTFLVPETNGRTLEYLSGENATQLQQDVAYVQCAIQGKAALQFLGDIAYDYPNFWPSYSSNMTSVRSV